MDDRTGSDSSRSAAQAASGGSSAGGGSTTTTGGTGAASATGGSSGSTAGGGVAGSSDGGVAGIDGTGGAPGMGGAGGGGTPIEPGCPTSKPATGQPCEGGVYYCFYYDSPSAVCADAVKCTSKGSAATAFLEVGRNCSELLCHLA